MHVTSQETVIIAPPAPLPYPVPPPFPALLHRNINIIDIRSTATGTESARLTDHEPSWHSTPQQQQKRGEGSLGSPPLKFSPFAD